MGVSIIGPPDNLGVAMFAHGGAFSCMAPPSATSLCCWCCIIRFLFFFLLMA